MNFALTVTFTSEQLEILKETNSFVAIAKPVVDADPNIIWVQFVPFQSNIIQWIDEYWFFASKTIEQSGINTKIIAKTAKPVVPDKLYTLDEKGIIAGPAEGGAKDQYSLLNNYAPQDYMKMGLQQAASVNDIDENELIISSNPVLFKSTLSERPENTIYIWIESDLKGKTAVNGITSPKTKFVFGDSVLDMTVKYNPAEGNFTQVT